MYLDSAPTALAPCWAPSQDDWLKLLSLTLPTSVTNPTLVIFIAPPAVPPVAVVAVAGAGAAVSVAAATGAVVAVAAAGAAVSVGGAGGTVGVAVSPHAARIRLAITRMA